jgi:hypothetical protein
MSAVAGRLAALHGHQAGIRHETGSPEEGAMGGAQRAAKAGAARTAAARAGT